LQNIVSFIGFFSYIDAGYLLQKESYISEDNMYYISAKKPHGSATEPCINIRKETIKETIFCK